MKNSQTRNGAKRHAISKVYEIWVKANRSLIINQKYKSIQFVKFMAYCGVASTCGVIYS